MLGSGISGNQMMGIMGAKAGLGFYQNYQQQKALEGELEDRDRLRRLQMQAMEDPMSVPGMRARRDLAGDAWSNKYRAQYGGTEGGAFAKGMSRYTDAAVSSGVNDYVNTLGTIGPGASKTGAAAGAGNQAMNDYMFLQMIGLG